MNGRILVAGIGNIFLGDDAFGVEVVGRLAARTLPKAVQVVDFGIRGLDLTYALLEPYDAVILIDAAPRGGAPGTLYLLEPNLGDEPVSLMAEMHALDPVKVLRLARSMGATVDRIFIVGCEPQPPAADDDFGMALSAPVQAALDEAVGLIESLIHRLRSNQEAESFFERQGAL